MRFSRKAIAQEAAASGWTPDVFEKAVRLLLLLESIDRHPFLSGKLLLKGGTALNLFLLDAPRLSVDIDLNFVGALDPRDAQAQRPEIERAVTAAANAEDYGVALSADAHAGRKFYLQYTNLSGLQDRLEVDINFLFRVAIFTPERRPSTKLMSGLTLTFPLVNWRELIAGKIVAAVDRVAARDVYDLAMIRGSFNLQDRPLRAAVIGLSGVLPHPLNSYDAARFQRVDSKRMETELRPFLRRPEQLHLQQIRSDADFVLTWLLKLTDSECLYIEGISKGQVEPEILLPGDPSFCDALRQHPALLWKIQNVRSHSREKSRLP